MRPTTPSTSALVRGAAVAALALAAAACQRQGGSPAVQYGAAPQLPEPHQYLLPPMHIAPVAEWGAATPTVSAGLKVEAVATGLKGPRFVYPLPNGDVLVVETGGPKAPVNRPKDWVMGFIEGFAGKKTSKPSNRIVLLRDTNGDGRPGLRTVLIDHLNSPFGVTLVGNDLYVADTDALLRFPYQPGQTQITARPEIVTELPGGPIDHHWTKSLAASADGSKLYVGVGSNSNIAENGLEAEKDRAAVWEIDRATGLKRIYAGGLRNAAGLAVQPGSGRLWAVVNERDELGPDLVPDYLTSVREHGFYGWPFSYYGRHLDPRVRPQRPDLVARAIVPDYALSSHVAPLGLAFSDASSLSAAYRSGVFIGEHGSWDRTPLNGYKVVYVPFSGGRPSGPPQDLVTGFLDAHQHARGRPVGVAVDRTGALLIADDLGKTVWRVSAAAGAAVTAQAPRPAGTTRPG